MNIFGFFLFLRFHTYYKSADDIKNIHNKLLSGQVTLLMFSSILVYRIIEAICFGVDWRVVRVLEIGIIVVHVRFVIIIIHKNATNTESCGTAPFYGAAFIATFTKNETF